HYVFFFFRILHPLFSPIGVFCQDLKGVGHFRGKLDLANLRKPEDIFSAPTPNLSGYPKIRIFCFERHVCMHWECGLFDYLVITHI
ncbi:hypothetical protein F4805DRAFT_443048, partial [Annulohypoxylon moriforme]